MIMITKDIDEMLENAFSDLDKGEDKALAVGFIKYYIKYLKKNIRLAYKVGLEDLFNEACDSDGELVLLSDKMLELEDEADSIDIDELLNGLSGLNCEEDS